MSDQGIHIEHLSKRFGEKQAVDDLSLSIDGGMFGLLGPNGAGKTTLMRMLCTLLMPSSGGAKLDGIPLTDKHGVRRIIGYLPQDFSFYPGFSVQETLEYLGLLSGMKDTKDRRKRIDEMLEMTNLAQHRKQRVRQLSGGMRRRLGIAQVLLADPRIVIVDEPTAGLDPEERVRFRNMLGMLASSKTVLFSTHIAEDILHTCPRAAVLHQGRLLFAGEVRQLIALASGRVWCVYVEQGEQVEALRRQHTIVGTVLREGGCEVRLIADALPCPGAEAVAPSLEDAYMLLIKGGVDA